MAIKRYLFLLSFIFISCSIRANEHLIDRHTYESYVEESLSNSAEKWILYKKDENFFYIKRKIGDSVKDQFKLKKDDVLVNTKKSIPTSEFVVIWKEDIKKESSAR